ncbi:MAG: DUF1131 domain-containing protein [Tepidamorphaceae bacterium]|nr:DUF1131 family protein [Rhodobiaceae bacterium]MCB1480355.1 DUF1131 family protein [Rhodobiaceae bacterium]MCC0048490.1 DUF1131 family protein [Rhodobiaceae bacterium]
MIHASRFRFPACVAVLTLLLAACAGQTVPLDQSGAISSAPASSLYTLTAASAGPITSATAYGSGTIKGLFPGRRTQAVQIADDERTVYALAVFEDGLQTIAVEPNKTNSAIVAVHGLGPGVAGPNGERIGMTFSEVGMNSSRCRAGKQLWAGMPICTANGAQNVTLVFDPGPGNAGKPGELPPRNVIGKSKLTRIVWTPVR